MINGIFIRSYRVGRVVLCGGSLLLGALSLIGVLYHAFSDLFVMGIFAGVVFCLEGIILIFLTVTPSFWWTVGKSRAGIIGLVRSILQSMTFPS